jgi:hypothetical protein
MGPLMDPCRSTDDAGPSADPSHTEEDFSLLELRGRAMYQITKRLIQKPLIHLVSMLAYIYMHNLFYLHLMSCHFQFIMSIYLF